MKYDGYYNKELDTWLFIPKKKRVKVENAISQDPDRAWQISITCDAMVVKEQPDSPLPELPYVGLKCLDYHGNTIKLLKIANV